MPASRPVPRTRPASKSALSTRDLSRPLPAALSWIVLAVFVAGFAVAVVVMDLPWLLPAWYGALSVVTFIAYWVDKAAARRNAPRISERSLISLGLVGGWPGALVAQQSFRHKTRKRTFRRAFWATVVVNACALVALVLIIESGADVLARLI